MSEAKKDCDEISLPQTKVLPSRGARFKRCVKVFLTHLISQVGLCLLVIAYSIAGAFIFKALEAPVEVTKRHEVLNFRNSCLHDLWNITISHNVFNQTAWMIDSNTRLRAFEDKLRLAVKDGYDGKDADVTQWTFSGALLYCITVITTIGYGNIAPKSDAGKVVTIFYSIVGIPLMLLCLSNIGNVLAHSFKFAYSRMCCVLCRPPPPPLPINGNDGGSPYTPPSSPENADRIPVYLVMLFVAGYIFLGAMLFSLWEKWSILDGAYFCYITLSTIGFGDFVPGQGTLQPVTESDGQAKLIICCLYLVLGLAIIAMSFNLVQEEVVLKCKDMARNLRLIASSDD